MPSSSCHTVLAESFFRRNAELFRPHLAAVGLREQILSAPESEIPVTKYVALWEVLGSEVSPTIGLEVAMRTESSELGAYGHAIRCAPSMQLVLRSLSRFMVVLTQATQLDFEDNGKRISLAYRVTDASIVQRRQDAEFTICTILNLLREVTRNPQLSPVRVDFEHRAPSDLASHREVFGCPIRFEQPDNRLYFSRELLDMPIRTADQRLFQALEPFLEQQRQSRAASTDVLSQVAHHIASSLSSGCASLEQVASDLKIGVRTLQRRLAEQNVGFSQLVEDVRRSLAESYVMQSDYSLTEIALLLGYSEASSFCRAFRRWTQLTPQQFRQRGRS
jgi:AraC-like DNA-binding protein